jgi:hypothetical protein
MASRTKLNRLINRVAVKDSAWQAAPVDFDALARNARVQHAVESLLQLGHEVLANELLRLEKQNQDARVEVRERPAA